MGRRPQTLYRIASEGAISPLSIATRCRVAFAQPFSNHLHRSTSHEIQISPFRPTVEQQQEPQIPINRTPPRAHLGPSTDKQPVGFFGCESRRNAPEVHGSNFNVRNGTCTVVSPQGQPRLPGSTFLINVHFVAGIRPGETCRSSYKAPCFHDRPKDYSISHMLTTTGVGSPSRLS